MSGRNIVTRIASIVAASLSLAACGGNVTSSSADATPPPATDAPARSAHTGHAHGHRHHRHRRNDDGANATVASPDPAASVSDAYPCDDASFVAVQGEFASGALEGDQLVNVCGTVTRVLPSRTTRSGLHGYFSVRVAPADDIEIVSDLGRMNAPAWPWVRAGDSATVRGRYYYDSASSQGIDWTHHGASGSWPSPGYVVINGTQYQ